MKYSDDQKRKKIAEIDKYRAEGMSVDAAARKAGTFVSSYYRWVKLMKPKAKPALKPSPKPKPAKRKKSTYVEHIVVEPQPTSKVACIIGTPQEIADVLKGMK